MQYLENGGILTEARLKEGETNQILINSTEQLSGSRQEYLNAMANSGTSIYTLTIHYIDSGGNRLTDDYVGQYIEGESFEIRSPNIAGYIPDYQTVSSSDTSITDGNGMLGRDVEIYVTYRKNSAPEQEPDPEKDMELTLEKVIVEPQARYTVGDVVKYRIILRNEGTVRVNSFKIQDTLTSKGNEMGLDLGTFTAFTDPAGQTYLDPGEEGYIDYEYKIKAEDVGGTVKNTVKLVEPKLPKPPKGEKEPEIEVVEPELALEKSVVEQKARYTVGDVVKYRITLRNEGSVRVNSFKIQDTLTSKGNEMGLDLGTFTAFTDPAGQTYLDPGEEGYIYYEYVIKEEDVGGTVKNTVKLVEPKLPKPPKGEKEPEIEVEPRNPGITVDKQVISTPANGEAYVEGETITYKIVVTNTGNVPLTNVVITDIMIRPDGTETIPSGFPNDTAHTPGIYNIEVINPGESVEITVTHEVTKLDVEVGTGGVHDGLTNHVDVYADQEVWDYDIEFVPVKLKCSILVHKKFNLIGDDTVSKVTAYVALFADKDGTQRISDIKSMDFTSSNLEGEVEFKDLKTDTIYFVFEVDKDGNPIYDGQLINIDGKDYKVLYNNTNGVYMGPYGGRPKVRIDNVRCSRYN